MWIGILFENRFIDMPFVTIPGESSVALDYCVTYAIFFEVDTVIQNSRRRSPKANSLQSLHLVISYVMPYFVILFGDHSGRVDLLSQQHTRIM